MFMFLGGRIIYCRYMLVCCLPKRVCFLNYTVPGSSFPLTPLLGELGQCHATSLSLSFLSVDGEFLWMKLRMSVPSPVLSWSKVLWWRLPPFLMLSYLHLTFMWNFLLLFMYQTNSFNSSLGISYISRSILEYSCLKIRDSLYLIICT